MSVEAFCVGGVMIDNIVAADGTVYRDQSGGNAVHSAAGARLWLGRVGVVGLIPSNYPFHWLERLHAGGLAVDGIRVVDEIVTRTEWLVYAADGSRADHLYTAPALDHLGRDEHGRLHPALEGELNDDEGAGRSFGAFRHDHPVTHDSIPTAFLTAAGAHLAGNRSDQQCAMARTLSDGGRHVTLDPGSNAVSVAQHLSASMLPIAAMLPSETELTLMVPDLTPGAALDWLIGRGAQAAVVKCGARGALVQAGTTSIPIHVPALPVAARDPTGAGDAFCGGFLAGLIRTRDPILAACCGTVSASFAVEGPGPFRLLHADRAEARRRLAWTLASLPPSVCPQHALCPSSPPS